jgi:hypothetical protein
MPLGRIRARPSCTVSMQPPCTAHVRPSLAQLGLGQRSARKAAQHCDGDLTGTRKAAGENMAGVTGAWTAARHELMGVDDGVGWHGKVWTAASGGTAVRRRPTRTTVERVSAAGRHENAVARRTHRRTDGVDSGVGALGHAPSGANSDGRWRAWQGGRR